MFNFVANRREHQTKARAMVDFFFPYTSRIRIEAKSNFNPQTGITTREFYTLRAWWWHYFYAMRNILFNLPPFPDFPPFLAPQLRRRFGAIAFDATSNTGRKVNADPWDFSHTCTGSDLTLVVGVDWWDSGGAITLNGVTYNSVSMTLGPATANSPYGSKIFYLASPATGANTVSVDFTAGSYGGACAVSFSGTNTSSPVDAQTTGSANSTSISTTITTNNANSFIVDNFSSNGGIDTGCAPGGSQTQNYIQPVGNTGGSSRRSTTTAGGYAMSWTPFVSGQIYQAVIAIKEGAAAATTKKLAALGVG